jgi:hypothetical protein
MAAALLLPQLRFATISDSKVSGFGDGTRSRTLKSQFNARARACCGAMRLRAAMHLARISATVRIQ